MKKLMIVVGVLVLTLSGCSTVHYVPYEGAESATIRFVNESKVGGIDVSLFSDSGDCRGRELVGRLNSYDRELETKVIAGRPTKLYFTYEGVSLVLLQFVDLEMLRFWPEIGGEYLLKFKNKGVFFQSELSRIDGDEISEPYHEYLQATDWYSNSKPHCLTSVVRSVSQLVDADELTTFVKEGNAEALTELYLKPDDMEPRYIERNQRIVLEYWKRIFETLESISSLESGLEYGFEPYGNYFGIANPAWEPHALEIANTVILTGSTLSGIPLALQFSLSADGQIVSTFFALPNEHREIVNGIFLSLREEHPEYFSSEF